MSKSRLITIIVASILGAALIGVGVWYFFFRDVQPEVYGYYEVVGISYNGNHQVVETPTRYIKIEENKITVWTATSKDIPYTYGGENKMPNIFKAGMDDYFRIYITFDDVDTPTFGNTESTLNYLTLKKIDKNTYNTKTA